MLIKPTRHEIFIGQKNTNVNMTDLQEPIITMQCVISDTTHRNTTYRNIHVSDCVFTYATFRNVKFEYAEFLYSSFQHATFKNVIFNESIEQCNFCYATLKNVTFEHCAIKSTTFQHATFKNVKFSKLTQQTYEPELQLAIAASALSERTNKPVKVPDRHDTNAIRNLLHWTSEFQLPVKFGVATWI